MVKGIVHFTIGVSIASCLPQAISAGAAGNPLYFILGGVFGLLPDTIDFKFCRFFCHLDAQVTPDPSRKDPQMIANAVAGAISRASSSKRTFDLKLNTIKVGPDAWQRYVVRFDSASRRVRVRYGPIVDTGQNTIEEESCIPELSASASLPCEIRLDYESDVNIDILDGTHFAMEPLPDGSVTPRFVPWHRKWTHSFVVGLLFALVAALLIDSIAGLVILGAYSAHIIVDQLGFMGSNLFFPFTRIRTRGMQLMHSGAAAANLGAVWLSMLLIFWNLHVAEPNPPSNIISPVRLLFVAALLPLLATIVLRRVSAWSTKDQQKSAGER